MSDPVQSTKFRCMTCRHLYDTEDAANLCEPRPVQHDRGVKVGDKVLITAGDGAGGTATVKTIYIIDRDWGPPAFWHSVALTAKVDDSWGHRTLTFDSYEKIPADKETPL